MPGEQTKDEQDKRPTHVRSSEQKAEKTEILPIFLGQTVGMP